MRFDGILSFCARLLSARWSPMSQTPALRWRVTALPKGSSTGAGMRYTAEHTLPVRRIGKAQPLKCRCTDNDVNCHNFTNSRRGITSRRRGLKQRTTTCTGSPCAHHCLPTAGHAHRFQEARRLLRRRRLYAHQSVGIRRKQHDSFVGSAQAGYAKAPAEDPSSVAQRATHYR